MPRRLNNWTYRDVMNFLKHHGFCLSEGEEAKQFTQSGSHYIYMIRKDVDGRQATVDMQFKQGNETYPPTTLNTLIRNAEPFIAKKEWVRWAETGGRCCKGIVKDVVIGEGNLAGKGVYANRDFKKDEIVIKYNLKPLTDKELENLPESEKMFIHTHEDTTNLYSEPERYVNHSESPNTYQDLISKCDIALRDISKGEEITTDATKDDIS